MVAKTQPDGHHVDAQPVDFSWREYQPPESVTMATSPACVQQAMLSFHIIGFLLPDLPKLLAGQEDLRRVIDMDMHTDPLLTAGNHQGTGIQ